MMIQGNSSRGGAGQKAALPRRVFGFTLIEMLVVIAVIGILAALLLGGMPAIQEKRIRSTVRAELGNLITHIEAYKEKHGFYPPDGPNALNPPLFYELVGTTVKGDEFFPLNGETNISATVINANYGRPGEPMNGFMNSSPDGSEVKNFLTALKRSQYDYSPFGSGGAMALRVPAKGPDIPGKPGAEQTNTWRYVVARPLRKPNDTTPYPTNNPASFDLWAEVTIRGRTVVIGNWKEE